MGFWNKFKNETCENCFLDSTILTSLGERKKIKSDNDIYTVVQPDIGNLRSK
jgi:hypothetical protein